MFSIVTTTVSAVAYAAFVLCLAACLSGGPAGRARDIAFVLTAFLFLPAGYLPPILPFPWGLIAVPVLLVASVAGRAKEERLAVARFGTLPMGVMALAFGFTAFYRGLPGDIADFATFAMPPLWTITGGGGKTGLLLAAAGFTLLAGRAFAGQGVPALLRRLVAAQFLLALVLPLTLLMPFPETWPVTAALAVGFILNWGVALLLGMGIFPAVATWRSGTGKGPLGAWALLAAGLLLLAADTLEVFRSLP